MAILLRPAVFVGGAIAFAALSGAAFSEDILDWSGAYAGGHIGYGQGTVEGSYSATEGDFAATTETTPRYYYGTNPPQVELDPSNTDYVLHVYANIPGDQILTFDPSGIIRGAVGGVQAGYNWQSGSAVYGIDASLAKSGIRGDATFENIYPGSPDVAVRGAFTADLNWIAMLRGKAGFATGNFLPYVAGGLAIGQADIQGSLEIATPNTSQYPAGSSTAIQFGLTAAVGVEVAVTESVSFFAEYGYVAFMPFDVEVGDGADFAFNLDSQLIRTGLNVHF